jgi:hypothetical protein
MFPVAGIYPALDSSQHEMLVPINDNGTTEGSDITLSNPRDLPEEAFVPQSGIQSIYHNLQSSNITQSTQQFDIPSEGIPPHIIDQLSLCFNHPPIMMRPYFPSLNTNVEPFHDSIFQQKNLPTNRSLYPFSQFNSLSPFSSIPAESPHEVSSVSSKRARNKSSRTPRPLNSFMLFRKGRALRDCFTEYFPHGDIPSDHELVALFKRAEKWIHSVPKDGTAEGDRSVIISRLWKSVDEEGKTVFKQLQEWNKQLHAAKYPGLCVSSNYFTCSELHSHFIRLRVSPG